METFFKMLIEAQATYNFLEELSSFNERNLIHGKECCPRCLKAHLLKASKDEPVHFHKTIKGYLRGEIGHNGYYLDGDEVIKI